MSELPDEIWRHILEIGIRRSNFTFRELCCVSMCCRSLRPLSDDAGLWSFLLSSDFPQAEASSSSSSSPKLTYQIEFDRKRTALAYRSALGRMASKIVVRSRKLQKIQMKLTEETEKMKAAVAELSKLREVRQAEVALNVGQPELIRGWQEQMVEHHVGPVGVQINYLEMMIRVCTQQIEGFDNAYQKEKRRLISARERLGVLMYQPSQDYRSISSGVDESGSQRKKLRRCSDVRLRVVLG